jgi:NAD(P)-dependent dehydrogenase (short-subunit alcohol dehydrogenase family)
LAKPGQPQSVTVQPAKDRPGAKVIVVAKADVTGLTKTLAKEWGRYNVTVNTVALGLINTRLTKAPGRRPSRSGSTRTCSPRWSR